MADLMFTRTMFCERCAKSGNPRLNQLFIVHGQSGHDKILKVQDRVGQNLKGYVPHLVSIYRRLDEKSLAITRVCCMNNCGVKLQEVKDGRYEFVVLNVSYEVISIKDWNALISNWKDTGYEL